MQNIVYEGKIGEKSFQVGKQFSYEKAPFYINIGNAGQSLSNWYDLDGMLLAVKDQQEAIEGEHEGISDILLHFLEGSEINKYKVRSGEYSLQDYSVIGRNLDERHMPAWKIEPIFKMGFEFAHRILEALEIGGIGPEDGDFKNYTIGSLESDGDDNKYRTQTPVTFKPLVEILDDQKVIELLRKLDRNFQKAEAELRDTSPSGLYFFTMKYPIVQ